MTESEEDFQAAYQLSHAIGSGGAGDVWLAVQRSLGRRVVVKFIRAEMVADELSRKRFEREARVLSKLSHPHIVPVYEYGSRAGQPYLVMEYVAGGSLTAHIDGATAPGDLFALRVATQVADGLDCLHREGIVHRDIKPGNILLTETGVAKLADFGLARHAADRTVTTQGPLLGTPHYVAPEVLLGSDPSPASDLYALGVVLYQLLARRLPWPSNGDIGELIAQRVNVPADPLDRYRDDLPRTLTALVNRLLIPDAERRPADAGEVKRTLEELTEQSFGKLKTQSSVVASKNIETPREISVGSSPPPARRIWPVAMLGLLTVAGLWVAATRMREPFALAAQPEVRQRPGGIEVHYLTNRACPTVVRVAVKGASVSRTVTTPEPAAREHRAVVADLPEGKTVDVALQFPDGGASTFSVPVAALLARPLEVERLPRRVSVELTTTPSARVEVQVVATGGRPSDEAPAAKLAKTPPGHAHRLEIDGLAPRQVYELQVKVIADSGEERALPPQTLLSPVAELLDLARAVRAADLEGMLDRTERARKGVNDAPHFEPVQHALDAMHLAARRDELARVLPRAQLDRELTDAEKRNVYDGLTGLRLVDRFAAAHGLNARTGVAQLMPPDLAWGDAPLFPVAAADAYAPFPRVEGLAPERDLHVNVWADGPRLASSVAVTLAVPALAGVQRAQLALKCSRNRAAGYILDMEGLPVSLLFVPPDDTVFKPDQAIMYHAVPVAWLRPGPVPITLRLRVLPGYYRNVRSEGTVKISDLRANCPVPDELALFFYQGSAEAR